MADEAWCTPLHPENMGATCSDVRELLAPTSFHVVHGGCASPLNVDRALIGQLSPLGKLSPAIESSRACPSYRVSEGGRGHGRVADERQMLTQDGRSTVSARLSTLSTLSFMNQCQRQRLASELMIVRI